jgi:gliding motility-associated-like protein
LYLWNQTLLQLRPFTRKLLLCFTLLTPLTFTAYSQSFYTVDDNSKIRLETVTPSGISSKTLSSCVSDALSIAVSKDTMYITTFGGGLYRSIITSNGLTNCTYLTGVGNMNALTISKSGKLYMARDKELYSYDPVSKHLNLLGIMPDASSGDLTFFRDDLYLAGTMGIYKINITNPALSTLEIPTGSAFYGFASIKDDNSKTHLYGLALYSGTDLVELDLDNKTILGAAYTVPYNVYDSASELESGGAPLIKIERVDVVQECNYFNKGYIEVESGPHTEVYTYTLNNGQSNTTGLFNNLQPGKYKLTVTTTTGVPPVEKEITIPNYSLTKPTTTYKTKIPVCDLQGTVQLDVKGTSASYYIKYENETYPASHIFSIYPNYYNFTILDQNNCIVDEITLDLTKAGPCNPVKFPNAFTPNGDGINDVFQPSQDSRASKYQLNVFNRYGSLLFTSKSLALGWDGISQGKIMPTGTYYWMVNYVDINGKPDTQKGFVTMIR